MFVLRIPFTSTNLSLLKVEISRRLPDVKSSHRCEAIARGLGFKTYAACRASAQLSVSEIRVATGAAFQEYLLDHQFDVLPQPFYFAVARVAIMDVLRRMPRLTAGGIGIGRPRRTTGEKCETIEERKVKFNSWRAELVSDNAIVSFLLCIAFLGRVHPTKTVRPATNSYWLKHVAESYSCTFPEGQKLGPRYVPNGVLIAAAIHAGFKIKTSIDELGYESLNVTFNMSSVVLEDLDFEIRPTGATAQDRRRREERREHYIRA